MMLSLTLDNLNPEMLSRLNCEAARRGVEVKVLVKEIIQDRLGPAVKSNENEIYHDLDALAGTWSPEDATRFLATVADMRQCDEDLWK